VFLEWVCIIYIVEQNVTVLSASVYHRPYLNIERPIEKSLGSHWLISLPGFDVILASN